MPVFRGIDISVIASREAKRLPEYPHPDGSSVHLLLPTADLPLSPSGGTLDGLRGDSFSFMSDNDSTRVKKVNPKVSVYIPSAPGEQFWLKYHVVRSPPPSSHLYFKMMMNGRVITSWGILTSSEDKKQTDKEIGGTVMRSLYEPSERWRDSGGQRVWKKIGIETRYFYFMPALEQSAAEDGGMIEVQVFRSKGRKRRAPNMMEFRKQDRYGIVSPSGGLIDNPQEAKYYDWLLIDAKGSPYATFCFHYRSMNSLLDLNLIPRSDSRARLPMATSRVSKEGQVTPTGSIGAVSPSTPRFAFKTESSDRCIFEEARSEYKSGDEYRLKSPPMLWRPAHGAEGVEEASKTVGGGAGRPVPPRPLPQPPHSRSRASSPSSQQSSCPSLTPSLAQYVDSGEFGEEEVRVGVAHRAMLARPLVVTLPPRRECGLEGSDSGSDYENSPPSTVASRSPKGSWPKTYMPTTGSVLERHLALFSSPVRQPAAGRVRSRIPVSVSDSNLMEDSVLSQLMTLKMSESEWMRHSPSPTHKGRPKARMWSPQLERDSAEAQPRRGHRRGRYSDVGPRSSYGRSSWEARPVASVDVTDARDSAGGDGESSAHNDGVGEADEAVRSALHSIWDSCREPGVKGKGVEEVEEMPAGNWI